MEEKEPPSSGGVGLERLYPWFLRQLEEEAPERSERRRGSRGSPLL